MKKYDVQMLINKKVTQSFWEGIESDSVPKMIDITGLCNR